MNTVYREIIGIAATLAATISLASPIAGQSFELAVLHEGASGVVSDCAVFESDGRLAIDQIPQALVWTPGIEYPGRFTAGSTTDPQPLAPYFLAIHGEYSPNGTISGSSIDSHGRTFVFAGRRAESCKHVGQSGGRASGADTPREPDVSGADPAQPWQVQMNPCHNWFCDPIADPIRDVPDAVASALRGRSYRLTAVNSADTVREFCWRFGDDRILRPADGSPLAWSPNVLGDPRTTFVSGGIGPRAVGVAYVGELIGDGLLAIVGAEMSGTRIDTVIGFAREVSDCSAQ